MAASLPTWLKTPPGTERDARLPPEIDGVAPLDVVKAGPFQGFSAAGLRSLKAGATPAGVKKWDISLLEHIRRDLYNQANAVRRRIKEVEALPDTIAP